MSECGLHCQLQSKDGSTDSAGNPSFKFSYVREVVIKALHRNEHLPCYAIESLLNFLPLFSENPRKVRLFPSILKLNGLEDSLKESGLERKQGYDSVAYVINESQDKEPSYIVVHVDIRKFTMTFYDQKFERDKKIGKRYLHLIWHFFQREAYNHYESV